MDGGGIRSGLEERDEVGISADHVKRRRSQGSLQLDDRAYEGRDLEAKLRLERALDLRFDVGSRLCSVEDDVTAVDVGPRLPVAESLEDLCEPGHLHGALTDVDGSEEGDAGR